MKAIISAKNLNKAYGDVKALNHVDLDILPGQIVGLIGPNGAGKSTLLKAIFGLVDYQGELHVNGLEPKKHRTKLLERMCFIADVAILPDWLLVKNAISFVDGVHPRFDKDACLNLLKKTDIPLSKKVGQLSKGMVVQLHLALVMAIDADILVLDEPTLGLDILYRKEFYRRILEEYYHEQRTIIITTHQVEEIESILTDVVIINNGGIALEVAMDEFQKRFIAVESSGDNAQKLHSLKPIDEINTLGKTRFLFDGVDSSLLENLGSVSTPSVSDVFVACCQKGEK